MAVITLLYVPCPSRVVAVRLAKQLLSARLIGCANIVATESCYAWRGKYAQQREYLLLAKTMPMRAAAARAFVVRRHPYEVPLFGQCSLRANAPYARWLAQQVGSK